MGKKLTVVFALIVSIFVANAQDTIVFRSGERVTAKVTEVSDSEVRYLLWDNMNGPTYVKKLSEIAHVKYNGGHIDSFGSVDANNTGNQKGNAEKSGVYIQAKGGSLKIGGNKIRDEYLQQILTQDEYETYVSSVKQYNTGKAFVISGVIMVGVGSIMYAEALTNKNSGLLAGALTFLVSSCIIGDIGIPLWAIGAGRMRWVASSYNGRENGLEMSLSAQPAVFNGYTSKGGGVGAYGVCVTLNF